LAIDLGCAVAMQQMASTKIGMEGGDVSLAELWETGDYKSIADRVSLWKEHTKN